MIETFQNTGHGYWQNEDRAQTIRTPDGGGSTEANLVAFDTTQITSKANRSNPQSGDPCHPLTGQGHPPAIAFNSKASGMNGFGIGELAPALRAQNGMNGHHAGGGTVAVASEEFAVRRLTVVECARLMGFEDTYCHIETESRRKIEPDEADYLLSHNLACVQEDGQWYTNIASDSPMYRAFGNSQAVPVMHWIGNRIAAMEDVTS